jgi:hypothetical protein
VASPGHIMEVIPYSAQRKPAPGWLTGKSEVIGVARIVSGWPTIRELLH